jgi:hypothetical protein
MAVLRGLCTVEQIERISPPDEPYGAETTPSRDTVEAWIDEDMDLLIPVLRANGIVIPIINPETQRIISIVQSYRVAARIQEFEHFEHGQVESPYGAKLKEQADTILTEVYTKMLLPRDSTNGTRVAIPQMDVWTKEASEVWDKSQEDVLPKTALFLIDKEF